MITEYKNMHCISIHKFQYLRYCNMVFSRGLLFLGRGLIRRGFFRGQPVQPKMVQGEIIMSIMFVNGDVAPSTNMDMISPYAPGFVLWKNKHSHGEIGITRSMCHDKIT